MTSGSSRGFGAAPNAPFWLVSQRRTLGLAPGHYVFGRAADADIQISNDPNVSRRHVRLVVTADAVEVEDLGSTNGTFLDGELVQHPMRMRVGSKLRVGAEEFELRRLRPARQRRDSATTSPDIPVARIADARSEPEAPTHQDTPVDLVHDQVVALLDQGRVADARRFVDPLLDLLELGHRPLQQPALERVSRLALGVAEACREGRYADWVVTEHRRRGRLMSPRTVELFERVLYGGLSVDPVVLESYLSAIGELGLARGPEDAGLVARLRAAAEARGFTVPAPPPSEG